MKTTAAMAEASRALTELDPLAEQHDAALIDDAMGEERITPLKVLVIGANQCWGKADTLEEALKHAYNPKNYVVYIVHPDTTVHEVDGAIMYPDNYAPKKIMSKMPKK